MPPLVSQRTTQSAPGVRRGLQALERVACVGLEAVEEVLGVEEDVRPCLLQVADGVGDHRQVLFERRLEDLRTWRSCALPTMVTTGVSASSERLQVGVGVRACRRRGGWSRRRRAWRSGGRARRRGRRTRRPSGWSRASRPRCSGRRARRACGRSSACPRRRGRCPPSGCRRAGWCRRARRGET